MTPFAYQLIVWDMGEIDFSKTVPTLRTLVAKTTSLCQPHWPDRNKITLTAFYEDETTINIDAHILRVKVELNMDKIRAEARRAIKKGKKSEEAWYKKNPRVGTITSSPSISDFSEDEVMEGIITGRQWRWKTEDEIDWAELEGILAR